MTRLLQSFFSLKNAARVAKSEAEDANNKMKQMSGKVQEMERQVVAAEGKATDMELKLKETKESRMTNAMSNVQMLGQHNGMMTASLKNSETQLLHNGDAMMPTPRALRLNDLKDQTAQLTEQLKTAEALVNLYKSSAMTPSAQSNGSH